MTLEITLEPVAREYGKRSGRIVVARSRGNSELWTEGGTDYSSRVLEAGIELADGPYMLRKISKRSWSDDYHILKLVWTPDRLQFLVDDEEIGRIHPPEGGSDPFVRGGKLAPFDKKDAFWLARDQWLPTWKMKESRLLLASSVLKSPEEV